jgi:hypothetical protein
VLKFHEATHIVGQVYGLPDGILHVFNIAFIYQNDSCQLHLKTPCVRLSQKRTLLLCCSSTKRRRAFAGRHVFVLASSSVLQCHKRTYLTILESADQALFKMVRYVLLRPLRPELDAKTKTCLPAKTRFCHLDEQAIYQ